MTMNECKALFAHLSEYLDEELPADVCAEIESHIASCPLCVEFVESLKKSIDQTRRFEPSGRPAPLPEPARQELLAAYRKMLDARK